MRGSAIVSASALTNLFRSRNPQERDQGCDKVMSEPSPPNEVPLRSLFDSKENLNPNSNLKTNEQLLLSRCFSEWTRMTKRSTQISGVRQSGMYSSNWESPTFTHVSEQHYQSKQTSEKVRLFALKRFFSSLKQTVREQKLFRVVDQLAQKQLLAKAFKALSLTTRLEAIAAAKHHLKITEIEFSAFSAWKRYCLQRLQLKEKSETLTRRLNLERKLQVFSALYRSQSKTQRNFVEQRMFARIERERLLRRFYPLRKVLRSLVAIRVASIKLSLWLRNNRLASATQQMISHFRRAADLLRNYRTYKLNERLRLIMNVWLKQSQLNFVRRKQYQLSTLFHKTHLQKKAFRSLIVRAQDGQPLRRTCKVLKKYLKEKQQREAILGLKMATASRIEAQFAASFLQMSRMVRSIRKMQSACARMKAQREDNWRHRKCTALLRKKLQITAKQSALALMAAHSRYDSSQDWLLRLASALYSRRLLARCWEALTC